MHMKNGRNLRQLILFSLAAGCTLGGLGGGDVYANGYPPYEQILYINENNTVTQSDTDPNLKVDTSGLLKDGNFTYDTGDKLSKEKRGLIIMNSKKDLKSYTVDATLGADSSKTVNDYKKSDYQTFLLQSTCDDTTIQDVNLQVKGLLAHNYGGSGVYGIYSGGAMKLDNLTINSDLKNAIKDSGIVNTNAYFIGKRTTNIGNLYIDTKLDPNSTTGASIAHNGLYADGGPSSMSRGIPISTIISPREPMKAMTMSMKSIPRGTLIPSARTMPYQLSTVTVRQSISMLTKTELS